MVKNCSREHLSEYIEEIGIFFEQTGMPKMAGRILGRLLVCAPPHQSMQALADYLQASKGSISSAGKMLRNMGIVERIGLPGDRNDYYRIKPNVWSEHFEMQISRMTAFRNLVHKGLDMLKEAPPEQKQRLMEMSAFYAWLDKEMPLMFKRWETERKKSDILDEEYC